MNVGCQRIEVQAAKSFHACCYSSAWYLLLLNFSRHCSLLAVSAMKGTNDCSLICVFYLDAGRALISQESHQNPQLSTDRLRAYDDTGVHRCMHDGRSAKENS
jgi:hypothetical protein